MPANDAAAFRVFLRTQGLEGRWTGEPQRIDSDEIRSVYSGLRFYYTYAREPLPPGAPMPDLIAAYDKARAEYLNRSLRITVGIDDQRKVRAFRNAEDFNLELRPLRNSSDAAVAAAAILSLMNEPGCAPRVIEARQIHVQQNAGAFVCQLHDLPGVRGEVDFSRSGKCVRVQKQSATARQFPP
jgi:hypothetical protein